MKMAFSMFNNGGPFMNDYGGFDDSDDEFMSPFRCHQQAMRRGRPEFGMNPMNHPAFGRSFYDRPNATRRSRQEPQRQQQQQQQQDADNFEAMVDISGIDPADLRVTADTKTNSLIVEAVVDDGMDFFGRRRRRVVLLEEVKVPENCDVTKMRAVVAEGGRMLKFGVPKEKNNDNESGEGKPQVEEEEKKAKVAVAGVEIEDLGEDAGSDNISSQSSDEEQQEPIVIIGLEP